MPIDGQIQALEETLHRPIDEPAYFDDELPAHAEIDPIETYTTPVRRAAETAGEPQTVVKRPFGFFGRKKTIPLATTPPKPLPRNTGDLFDDEADDELEIPSFLRRQNL